MSEELVRIRKAFERLTKEVIARDIEPGRLADAIGWHTLEHLLDNEKLLFSIFEEIEARKRS